LLTQRRRQAADSLNATATSNAMPAPTSQVPPSQTTQPPVTQNQTPKLEAKPIPHTIPGWTSAH